MGLAIVHRIVEEHEGDIQVKCDAGHTRFSLWFPLAGDVGSDQ
jgi:nitrogen-specific signal transduction histidine kinase